MLAVDDDLDAVVLFWPYSVLSFVVVVVVVVVVAVVVGVLSVFVSVLVVVVVVVVVFGVGVVGLRCFLFGKVYLWVWW